MIDIKKRLQDQIKAIEYELKVTLPKEIQTAREFGDLRENAEYKSAKERQTFLQAKVSLLHGRLAALSMVKMQARGLNLQLYGRRFAGTCKPLTACLAWLPSSGAHW